MSDKETYTFASKEQEALHVLDWHLHSDKTTDPKGTDMTLEEAEAILTALAAAK